MQSRDDIRRELRDLSPELEERLRPQDGFEAPEGYFATFGERLSARLAEERATSPAPIPERTPIWVEWGRVARHWMQQLLRPAPALAFATVVLLIVGYVVFKSGDAAPESTDALFASLTEAEVAAYLDDHLYEYETATLEAAAAPATLDDLDLDAISTDALDDYLMDDEPSLYELETLMDEPAELLRESSDSN